MDKIISIISMKVLALLLAVVVLSGCKPGNMKKNEATGKHPAPSAQSAPDEPTVSVIVDFQDGSEIHFPRVKWTEGMTVFDCMAGVKNHPRGIDFQSQGSGETALLTKIEDMENGTGDGAAWIFYVNGEMAHESFGLKKLKSGDTVLWKFQQYR